MYIDLCFLSLLSPPAGQPHAQPRPGGEAQRQPVAAGLVPRGHQELPRREDHQLHHLVEERPGLLRPAAPLQARRHVSKGPRASGAGVGGL